jgi:hypothetical protein
MFPRIDKGPIEYALAVYPAFNIEAQRACIRFHFSTAEEFSHFQYNIAIEEQSSEGVLSFALKGLKAKGLLPGVGVAESTVDLFDLAGEYHVKITKPGDIMNSFHVSVKENEPRLLEDIADPDRFLEISVTNVPMTHE